MSLEQIGRAIYHGPKVLRATVTLLLHGIRPAPMVWMRGRQPQVISAGRVVLGRRVRIDGLGVMVQFGALKGGELILGDDVYLSSGTSVVATERIEIGAHSRIGAYTAITDTGSHEVEEGVPLVRAPIKIGRNVWIGRNVTILPGVEIGDHSVVGAGSVVNRSLPDRTLAAGIPAREIRKLNASDDWVRA